MAARVFSGGHDAPLQKCDLFTILRGYPSTLEVQLMIEQAIAALAKEDLPRSQAATDRHEEISSTKQTAPSPSHSWAPSAPDMAWLHTLLKAEVESDIMSQLPGLVKEAVAKQLRSAAPQGDVLPHTTLPLTADIPTSGPGRPPITPIVPSRSVSSQGSTTSSISVAVTSPVVASPSGEDNATRQRERILSAIHDVEHQVNTLQRRVNELSHQQRTAHLRFGRFCVALSGADEATGHSSPPSGVADDSAEGYGSLYNDLIEALDQRETARARTVTRNCITALMCGVSGGVAPASPSELSVLDASALSKRSGQTPLKGRAAHSAAAQQLRELIKAAPPVPLRRFSSQPTDGQPAAPAEAAGCSSPNGSYVARASPGSAGSGTESLSRQWLPHPQLGTSRESNGSLNVGLRPRTPYHRAPGAMGLGIDVIEVPPGSLPAALGMRGGLRVLTTSEAAQRCGIIDEDIILAICGRQVETRVHLQETLAATVARGEVRLAVYRRSANLVFEITVSV